MTETVEGLVRVLCERHVEVVPVRSPETGEVEHRQVVTDGLLTTLGSLTMPGLEGGGSAAFGSREPVAVDVLDLAIRIQGELLRDLLRLGDRVRVAGLAELCRAWFVAWQASEPMPAEHPGWVMTLAGWRDAILALLDPPTTLELTQPCPLCGCTRHVDAEGVEATAVLVTYRGEDLEGSAVMSCRACGPIARGIGGIRAVAEMAGDREVA